MKVLFAVNDEKDAEAITRAYQKEYKEIITSKTVYYFNAIIKELQKDKTYDRIIISEDLEMFTSDNYQTVDKFIFEKMDAISDEATNEEGNDIPIILLCMDRRTKNDPLLVKLFGLGLYNVLVGQDRSVQKVAALMYKPRSKKEAKAYYKVEPDEINYSSAKKSDEVSENEIQNILNHYKKIGDNVPKCVQSFDSIASQYNKNQIKLIIEVLPANTKAILENNSDSYRKIMGIKGKKTGGTDLKNHDYVEKEIDSGSKLTQPVIIPTAVSAKTVNKVTTTASKKKKVIDEEKLNREKEKAEAKRKAEEKIAREKAEARKKEEERIAREEAEAKRREEERIAREEAEAKRREEEKIAKEKEEEMKKEEIENANVAVVKRGRGRPRKNPVQDVVLEDVPVKRRRGRPRKDETLKIEEEKLKEKAEEKSDEIVVAKKQNKKVEDDNDLLSSFDDLEELDINNDIPEEDVKEQYDDEDFDFDDEDFNFEDDDEEDTFNFEDEDEAENEDDFDFEDDDENDTLDFKDEDDVENEDDFNFEDENEEDTLDFEDEDEAENEDDFDFEDDDENDTLDFKDEDDVENEDDFNFEDENEEDTFDFEDEDEEENEDDDEEDTFDFEDESEEDKNDEDLSSENEDEEDVFDFEDDEEEKNEEDVDLVEDEQEDAFDSEDEQEESVDESKEVQHNGAFKEITNKNYKYDNNLANSIKDLKETEERESYNIDTDNLITSGQKIISFVGTSKNGTSFIVNNLAEIFSNRGIKTAILDLTKNKNSYYIYTNNEDELREKAQNCLEKLIDGAAEGIEVNKNLTVYTSLPTQDAALDDVTGVIKTLLENYTVVLLDCDFDTDVRYFRVAQEMYLVQSLDVLTIQPLTAFLRDLKVKNILDTNKLRIVINKNIKMNYLNEKVLIGGMSVYNDPGMTYMTELFNKDTIKFVTIPLENQVYVKYLEGLVNCKITTSGYSKYFNASLNKLADMVYPVIGGKKSKNKYNDYSNQNKNFEDTFSKNTSSVLNKMKKKY